MLRGFEWFWEDGDVINHFFCHHMSSLLLLLSDGYCCTNQPDPTSSVWCCRFSALPGMVLNRQDWLEGQVSFQWLHDGAHLKISQNRLLVGRVLTITYPFYPIFIPVHCRSSLLTISHHDWPLVMAMIHHPEVSHTEPRGSPSHVASAFRRPPPAKAKPNPITGFNAPPDTLPGTITETPGQRWLIPSCTSCVWSKV